MNKKYKFLKIYIDILYKAGDISLEAYNDFYRIIWREEARGDD